MATNRKYANADQLPVVCTSPANPVSNDPVLLGNQGGVALESKRASDNLTAVGFKGVYTLPISNAVAIGNIIGAAAGSPVVLTAYANDAALVAAGGIFFGIAMSARAGAGPADVRLGR